MHADLFYILKNEKKKMIMLQLTLELTIIYAIFL